MRHPIVTEDLEEIAAAALPFDALSGATVLVTGASGILASYLVEALLHLNDARGAKLRVLGLVRSAEKARRRFAHYEGRADLELLVQDVCAPVRVASPVDFVVHAASPASPKHYGSDPIGTLRPNVSGTENLLELARAKKTRSFLFFSGGEVYGTVSPERIPTKETDQGLVDPMNVRSCYAESKRMGETLCKAWHHQHGVPAKVARIYHTYGPLMPLDDGRVFADFVADLVAGRDIVMKSDGSAVRVYCYLADAVRGFLTLLLQGAPGEAYNLANDEAGASVLELAERLVALFPEKKLAVVRQAPTPDYLASPIARTMPDVSKLRALGWRPRHSIESGFRRTVLSYS
ncbi:MAG: NAD-dependent epimerase/dehydratase family protein [Planctomycetota bacterium]